MRKLYFIVMLTSICGSGQIVNIPDANFKNALVNTACVDIDADGLSDVDVDSNDDGVIDQAEAAFPLHLNVSGHNIADAAGIEYFVNLQNLSIYGNDLTSLEVDALTQLEWLDCGSNALGNIDVSALGSLRNFRCDSNQLSALNVQNNSLLTEVHCANNLLTSITLCGTAVDILWCYGNPGLNYISVKNNVISSFGIGRTAGPPPLPSFDFGTLAPGTTICYDEGELEAVTYWQGSMADLNLITDCECTLRRIDFSELSIGMIPNPANRSVTFDFGTANVNNVFIYDTSGHLIRTVPNDNSSSLTADISSLAPGTYLVRIGTDSGMAVKKLIKL